MHQVNIHEAKTHLSKLIREVMNGEEVVIAKGNKPVVKLTTIQGNNAERKLGSAKGKIFISKDFETPLDDFKEYIQ